MEYFKPEAEHGIVHRFPDDTCFKYCGWPTVCRDERGVIYAAASGMRLTHVDPVGKNCMWVSLNQGKTWSPTMILNDSHFDDRDTGICYLGNGKMVASWFTCFYDNYLDDMQDQDWFNPSDKAITKGFGNMWRTLSKEQIEAESGSFVALSDDYGMTWSERIKVPLSAPHGPSACRDGSLVYMGKAWVEEVSQPVGDVVVYTSRDCGRTWEYTGTVPLGEDCVLEQMHEPHVVELPNGRLLGTIRVHGRSENPPHSVYTTFSDDKGKTWSVPKCIGTNGMPPHVLVHSSGAVICSYSDRTYNAQCERAAVSYDNGETWTEDYILDDNIGKQKDMGYPSSVELDDGSILTVYYQALPDDWHTSVLYTKWRLNDRK